MNASNQSPQPVIAIVGPTASDKSELGIELALRMGGEIINCDSVQVYREIEIATAKVPIQERRGARHHLIDFVPPEINYTAGEWARAASQKIEEIEARGRVALIVGGTGFYLRALRRPLFESSPTDENLRRRLVAIRARRGEAHLHRMLQRLDPASATRLPERDWSRTQRALEFFFQNGRPLSAQRDETRTDDEHSQQSPTVAARLLIFALNPPRAELYWRINARVEAHFAAGLVEEVKGLLARGVPAESNALGAHGYRRVVEHLRGERALSSAIEQTKLDVRHYAKRQLTWFRREPGVRWVEGFGDEHETQLRVAYIIERLKSEDER